MLRIDDLDALRNRAGAENTILQTLATFGFEPDGETVRQSRRLSLYADALDALGRRGLLFHCACSRREISETVTMAGEQRCVGDCRRRAVDPSRSSIRVALDRLRPCSVQDRSGRAISFDPRVQADVIVRRRDGVLAYHLATVVDDAAQGVTDVVRGGDLLESTAWQLGLQQALGLPTPRYLHLPLIVDAHGDKLSKSMAALPVDDASPLPALRAAWQALGQAPALLAGLPTVTQAMQAAARGFRPERLPKVTHMTFAAAHNNPVAGAV